MGGWVDGEENQRAKGKKQNDRGKVKNIRRAELPWVVLICQNQKMWKPIRIITGCGRAIFTAAQMFREPQNPTHGGNLRNDRILDRSRKPLSFACFSYIIYETVIGG